MRRLAESERTARFAASALGLASMMVAAAATVPGVAHGMAADTHALCGLPVVCDDVCEGPLEPLVCFPEEGCEDLLEDLWECLDDIVP